MRSESWRMFWKFIALTAVSLACYALAAFFAVVTWRLLT